MEDTKESVKNIDLEENIKRAFYSIIGFVSDLKTSFGKEFIKLRLYDRILEKTNISNKIVVMKNINIFKKFYDLYENHINKDDFEFLNDNDIKLEYSENICIDISELWDIADNMEKTLIKQHFHVIFSYIIPESKCGNFLAVYGKAEFDRDEFKNEVNKFLPEEIKGGNEGKFITDMIGELNDTIDLNNISNPITAITGLIQNGFLMKMTKKLQNNVNNGEFDIEKLLDNFKVVAKKAKESK